VKLEPWEPDLGTIIARIDAGELDLQPDFQRGIAWSRSKQQRLLDTVLRGWAIPPVHLIVNDDERMSVLDGQQRLHALRLFLADDLPIYGRFPPENETLRGLHGRLYSELDESVQRRIKNFKIVTYRLYDFTPDEPYELFFRLNLPTGLTQSEKRNALVGRTHSQIRTLVAHAVDDHNWSKDVVGFSNARLAYDEAIARACAYVESGTLRTSISGVRLESLYRDEYGLSARTVESVEAAVALVSHALREVRPKLNKATLLTWLLVAARASLTGGVGTDSASLVADLMRTVEVNRVLVRRGKFDAVGAAANLPHRLFVGYLELYNDRASSRVNDVFSVLARDVVIWRLAAAMFPDSAPTEAISLAGELRGLEQDEHGVDARIVVAIDTASLWGKL
jgi:hypothetical protein